MSALRRVLGAPGLVLGLWALQLLAAWLLAGPVRVAARAALREYAWIDDGHLLSALIELLADNPSVAAVMAENTLVAGILGLAFWSLAYGAVIRRLWSKADPSELAAASVRFFPGVVAQTLWMGVFRAILVGIAAAIATKLPALAVVIAVTATAFFVVAADLARVAVVLHGARRFHPATAWRAFKRALSHPRLLAGAGALAIVQALLPALGFVLVLSDAGGAGSIWLARVLALGGLGLGLWRIGLSIEASEPET